MDCHARGSPQVLSGRDPGHGRGSRPRRRASVENERLISRTTRVSRRRALEVDRAGRRFGIAARVRHRPETGVGIRLAHVGGRPAGRIAARGRERTCSRAGRGAGEGRHASADVGLRETVRRGASAFRERLRLGRPCAEARRRRRSADGRNGRGRHRAACDRDQRGRLLHDRAAVFGLPAAGGELGPLPRGSPVRTGSRVAGDGAVLVSDTGNDRVARVDPDSGQARPSSESRDPRGIDVAADGTIYVVESETKRVGRYSSAGARLGVVGGLR